ncbi:MAG: zf-HC2 domain-containing protein [Terriglobales bacterium]
MADKSNAAACAQWAPDLSAYFDGELECARGQALQRHLESCLECGARLAAYRAMGCQLRALSACSAPAELAIRLRVEASHYAVRGQRWAFWRVRLTSAVQALALPMVVGTAAALFLFSALAGGMHTNAPAYPQRPDVAVGESATPPRLALASNYGVDGSVLVEAQIDATGHVYSYEVLAGHADAQLISRLNNQLLLSVFQPATTNFGQPTTGSLLVSYGSVDVRG